jgi:hypothetical protein
MTHKRSSTGAGGKHSAGRLALMLAAANPVAETALASADVDLALDLIGERIIAGGTSRQGGSSSRISVGVAFAAVALVVTAVALGAMLTTHTGIFPKTAGTENDTRELLRTDAPDFPALVARLTQNVAFPPGYSRQAYLDRYVNEPSHKPDKNGAYNTVQAAGVQTNIAYWAVCAWRGYWLQAHAVGNAADAAAGAAGLKQLVNSSDALKKWDSFWPKYLAIVENENQGSAALPAGLVNFDSVSCRGLEQPLGASK